MPLHPTWEERSARWLRRMAPGGELAEASAPPLNPTHDLKILPTQRTPPADEICFSYAGVLAVSESPRWYPPRDITISDVFGSVDTTGTSTTTVNVKRNGTTVATLSFGSGVNTATDTTITTATLTADTDYLTVEIATVGTGNPADLNTQVRFA